MEESVCPSPFVTQTDNEWQRRRTFMSWYHSLPVLKSRIRCEPKRERRLKQHTRNPYVRQGVCLENLHWVAEKKKHKVLFTSSARCRQRYGFIMVIVHTLMSLYSHPSSSIFSLFSFSFFLFFLFVFKYRMLTDISIFRRWQQGKRAREREIYLMERSKRISKNRTHPCPAAG